MIVTSDGHHSALVAAGRRREGDADRGAAVGAGANPSAKSKDGRTAAIGAASRDAGGREASRDGCSSFTAVRWMSEVFALPTLQRKRPVLRFRWIEHRTGPTPSTFFVESGRSRVSDRTGEPGGLDAAFREAILASAINATALLEPRAGAETNNR